MVKRGKEKKKKFSPSQIRLKSDTERHLYCTEMRKHVCDVLQIIMNWVQFRFLKTSYPLHFSNKILWDSVLREDILRTELGNWSFLNI